MKLNALFVIILAATAFSMIGGGLAGCGATDNGTTDGDADGDSDSDTDSDSDGDSIYDIQQGEVEEETVVSLSGVIVTSPTTVDSEYGSGYVWVQEPEGGEYSGIVLYMWSDVVVELELNVGDVLDVTGEYTEYYDLSEISVTSINDITVTGQADVPDPAVVNPADVMTGGASAEAYESVLVKIEDVSITDITLGYGQWSVTGGLVVDDYFFTTDSGPSTDNIIAEEGESFDSVTGIIRYGYEEFTLAPRFAEDYEGYTGDGEVDWDIYDIKQGIVPENTTFTLQDVIVTSPLTYNGKGFFIQEQAGGQYSGIYVYNYDGDTDPAAISVGDIIDITGQYKEFEGVSEFTISDGSAVTVTGTGTVPSPEVVDTADVGDSGSLTDNWEGVLVQVQNVTVATADDGYGVFEIDDDLYVDDDFFTSGAPDPAVGHTYTSITGPLHYSYSHFKILPRTSADLVD